MIAGEKKLVIAIDGPAGSGKSTIARLVAHELHYRYIDTGAMYRAMAWLVLHKGIHPADALRIIEAVGDVHLEVFPISEGMGVRVDGRDVTAEIRSEEISAATSAIAMIPEVREHLVQLYRKEGAGGGVVVEGRDIGTVAFPDADLKIFLTAGVSTRARRRLKQQPEGELKGNLEAVEESIRRRDERDTRREHAPLARAADAVEIDTTAMGIEEVCRRVLELVRSQMPGIRAREGR